MDVQEKTTVSPPDDETEYDLKIIDYGHGTHKLSIAPEGETPGYDFAITNLKLKECQWRDEDNPCPTNILRAVEYYGYHVTDVTRRPKHGLYENVRYLRDAVEDVGKDIDDANVIGRSGVEWASESLDSLQKLELLRAHLTDAEYDIVLFKAQETSYHHPSGNLDFPTTKGQTSASLKSLVMLMLAYAQDDDYLERKILPQETVENLVRRPNDD